MDMQVVAKAAILNSKVDAVYHKSGTAPNQIKKVLVYGAPEKATPFSLAELVNKITTTIGVTISADTITKNLPDAIGSLITDKIFYLREIYFYKDGANTSASEYAVWIDVKTNNPISIAVIDLYSISFKFWATANKKVLDEMKINHVNQLLLDAGITP